MKITIDLTFLLNTLIFIARKVNFNELFAAVFCFASFLTVVKITLNMLAERQVKFSIVATFLYILVGGAMFAVSYTELKFVGNTFTSLAEVLFYSISESVALIALYVSFLCFSHKVKPLSESANIKAKGWEYFPPKTYKAQIEEIALNDNNTPILRLKTSNINEPKTKVVDIDGALKFVDDQISLGNNGLKPIRDKIAFYSGSELKDEDIAQLNELFTRAVKN